MKKLYSILLSVLICATAVSQVSKTINLATAGTLSTLLTATEKTTITNLTITGTIDSRDFKTMRDNMPALAIVDISGASIALYTGSAGTYNIGTSSYTYPANGIPKNSFCTPSDVGKSTLINFIFPNSVTTIGDYAFSKCDGLVSITIPNLVTTIGGSAFTACTKLTNISLGNSISTIGVAAFAGCNMSSITIPNSVISMGDVVFNSCPNLKTVYCLNINPPTILINTLGSSGALNNVFVPTASVLAYKGAQYWKNYPINSFTKITINNPTAGGLASSLISGGYAPLASILSLTITGNMNNTDFATIKTYMPNLSELDLSGTIVANNTIPDNAFANNLYLTTIVLPSTLQTIGASSFSGCRYLSGALTIPSSVISIGDYAFKNCTNSLTISSNATTIGKNAFQNCTGLKGSLSLSNNITTINDSTFLGCSGLTGTLTLPTSLTSIGNNAFTGCSGISGTLTLPSSLTTIGNSSFVGCIGLSGILTFPPYLTNIGTSAFDGCTNFTKLYLKNNVLTIGYYAFRNCTSIFLVSVAKINPPTIFSNTFGNVNLVNCALEIPSGSTSLYQSANYWGQFVFSYEAALSNLYGITLQIGTGGNIIENNVILTNGAIISVNGNNNKVFTITPNNGYEIATFTYGGINVKSQITNNQYSTPIVNANTILNVTFQKTQYSLSIKSAESGTVNQLYDFGSTPAFSFIPSLGWKVNTVYYNNVDVTSSLVNGIYTVPAISANALLNVSFVSTATSAPELINSKVKVYSTNSKIIVEGTSKGELINIYTVNGEQIQSVKSQGERIVLPAQKNSVYLIKTENKAFKVIL